MFSFHHIHIKSSDPPASAEWYVEMFRASFRDVDGTMVLTIPGLGGKLAISKDSAAAPGSSGHRIGLEHFALATNELDRLLAKGVELLEPIEAYDPEEMARSTGMAIERIAFIRAPDEVRIEVIQLRDG